MPRFRLLVPAVVLLGAGAAIPLACSKAPDVGAVDSVSESRLADLEKKVHDLNAENEAAQRALGATGTEHGSLARAVGDMRDELRRLKEEVASRGSAAMGSGPDGAPSGTPSDGGAAGTSGGSLGTFAPASDGTYAPEVVENFDKLWEVAQKRRTEKLERENLHNALARAEVTLTPDQEALVLKLNREYSEKRQELFATMRGARGGAMQSDADRNEVRTKLEALQVQHETDLRAALPVADVEKVVAAIKQSYPGFLPRDPNDPRTRRGGMGN
jgi:hypothetical protein